MGTLAWAAQHLDDIGLRRPVAALASLAYGRWTHGEQSFLVDEEGHWLNRQAEATVASPIIHTTRYAAFRAWVLDNWCWQYRPCDGDTVVDVGAGIGEEAIVFSKLVGANGRVISIEAHPETFACLQETIRLSGLTNVTPVLVALSDGDGSATIADMDSHLTSSIVTGGEGRQVAARSLDSLADELGLGEIALLKMNIEGAERMAVRGMARSARRIAHVCISCHDFLADRGGDAALRTKAEVGPLLESYGYALTARPDHPDPWVRDYFYGVRML